MVIIRNWSWPEWRKAPTGLRVIHTRNDWTATYVKPSRNRHNGAIVRWDKTPFGRAAGVDGNGGSYVISPAADLIPVRVTAWELIGYEGSPESVSDEALRRLIGPNLTCVRISGGRALYEQVDFADDRPGTRVRLGRVDVGEHGLRGVTRWVEPETELEIVETQPEEN